MQDPFGRTISYLRISVTDRCDLRCLYCMAEDMTFLPRKEVMTLEETARLCGAFIDLGIRKIRVTGGEPLVRRNVMALFEALGSRLGTDLEELTLTTNGTRLTEFARPLADSGVKRINVSLDTLDPDTFRTITRRGDLSKVLDGLEAAQKAGLHVKINTVALSGVNTDEAADMLRWCGERGFDMTFIETMPLGEIEPARMDQYVSVSALKDQLAEQFTLTESAYRTGGPSRYMDVAETGTRVGFITPLSHTFCAACNRVRVTCTGRLYQCLGHNTHVDLRDLLRRSEGDDALRTAILEAIGHKPEAHDFRIGPDEAGPAVARHMSVTGG